MEFKVEIDDSKLRNIAEQLGYGDKFFTQELVTEMRICVLNIDLEKLLLNLATKKAKAYIKKKKPIPFGGTFMDFSDTDTEEYSESEKKLADNANNLNSKLYQDLPLTFSPGDKRSSYPR